MNEDIKNILLFNSAAIGFIDNEENYKNVSTKIKILHDKIKKLFEESSLYLSLNDKETEKLINDIKAGDIKFDTIRKVDDIANEKKLSEKEIKIKIKDRDNIAMHALNYSCKRCTRNKKKCLLRTSLTNARIPPYNNNIDECCYNME